MMTSAHGSLAGTGIDSAAPINQSYERNDWTSDLDAGSNARHASNTQARASNPVPAEFHRHGKRSLSGIALRAFCMGCTAIFGFGLAVLLVLLENRLWRPFVFLGTLSVFHFLEFYTTAAFNAPSAEVSSFLLTNGNQYRQAHTMAFFETCITSYLFPTWQARIQPPFVIALGVVLTAIGQTVRSTAMAQAGTNFNHLVQSRKNHGHELVTTGIYAYLRHPSYFGFFWWGIGTQIMLGNTVCFLGYTGVLWYFFKRRITHEEKHLVDFFGPDYEAYRARSSVWIPFI